MTWDQDSTMVIRRGVQKLMNGAHHHCGDWAWPLNHKEVNTISCTTAVPNPWNRRFNFTEAKPQASWPITIACPRTTGHQSSDFFNHSDMDRQEFIRVCCSVCTGGSVALLLKGCAGSKMVSGAMEGSDLTVPLNEFEWVKKA